MDDRGKLIAQITGRGDNSGLIVSKGKLHVTYGNEAYFFDWLNLSYSLMQYLACLLRSHSVVLINF